MYLLLGRCVVVYLSGYFVFKIGWLVGSFRFFCEFYVEAGVREFERGRVERLEGLGFWFYFF